MIRIRILIITLVAISIPLLLFGVVGCMKKPDHTPDYGPEVPFSKIEEALDELGVSDPMTIEAGEFAYVERTQVLDNSSPFLTLQRADTITEKTETSTQYVFKIVTELNEWIDGAMRSSKTESTATLDKPDLNAAGRTAPRQGVKPYDNQTRISIRSLGPSSEEDEGDYTFHNLKKEVSLVPIPELVQQRPDCGGLSDCTKSLRALEVSFDRVDWSKSEQGDRTAFKFIVSPDVPYFASQLLGCAQAWIDIEGRLYPLLQCEEIRDFKFGTP